MAFFIFIKSIITVVLFGDFKEVKIECMMILFRETNE